MIIGHTYQYSGFGCPHGALPLEWVVDALGLVPPDHSPEAVAYLSAAAVLVEPRRRANALNGIGL